ncbi:grsB, partial [Symbiodinium natans]
DVGKFEAESYNLSLPSSANCFELARKYGLEHGASQFQVLLAAYYWALHVATGKSDLVVSTSFHGR